MKRVLGSILGGVLGAALFFGALFGYQVARGDVNGGDNPSYPLAISLGGTGCGAPSLIGNPCFVDGTTAQTISGTKTFTQQINAMNGVVMGPSYLTTSSAFILGDIQASSDSANASRVVPVYNKDSTAMPATLHAVFFQQTITITGNCLTLTVCATSTNTVTLSGTAAPFLGTQTAVCYVSQQAGTFSAPIALAELATTTQIDLALFNQSNVTITGSYAATGVCIGF